MVELIRKIKKKYQKEIGYAQDLIVENIYKLFPDTILHGGTFIWRCLQGNRFSEDIDIFLPKKDEKKIEEFFKFLENIGFKIEKLRIKENSVFSKLWFGKVLIRVEIVFKNVKGELFNYECVDGRRIPVLGLELKTLLIQKIDAFLKRKKIRDLYDIYYLLNFVKKDEEIIKKLKFLIKNFEKPLDENELEKIILFGYAPKSEEIIEFLKKWIE